MKKTNIDWAILNPTLSLFGLSLLISAILSFSAYYFKSSSKNVFNNDKKELRSINQKYMNINSDKNILNSYLPKFDFLYAKGVIGDEERLNWVEILKKASTDIRIPYLSYSIGAQKKYISPYSVNGSSNNLYVSKMKLDLGLLHEGDLFSLLKELDKNAKGIFTVSKCNLKLNETEIKYDIKHNNINASCNLDWITMSRF